MEQVDLSWSALYAMGQSLQYIVEEWVAGGFFIPAGGYNGIFLRKFRLQYNDIILLKNY